MITQECGHRPKSKAIILIKNPSRYMVKKYGSALAYQKKNPNLNFSLEFWQKFTG